ncbi:MAG: hypothetical protein RLZZ350_1482 [Verrucomicrobiota bacterium]|jgi:hypothetical protein
MEISRKEIFLVGLVLALATAYVVWFTDWGKPQIIPIGFSARPYVVPRTRRGADGEVEKVNWSLTFALGRNFELTSVRVVDAAKFAADPKSPALWRLAGKSSPTSGFVYGADIVGLQPFVPGMPPPPLVAGVKYRIFVDATKAHGEQEFTLTR